jgi:hypothetical protein
MDRGGARYGRSIITATRKPVGDGPLSIPSRVREHARNLLAKRQRRGRYWDGYRSSGDMEELQRLVEKVVPFLEVGDGNNALRVLEPIAEAFVDDWLEHSFGADEHLYELFADLGRLMAEAALMSDLSADERAALAETLEDWQAGLRNTASMKAFTLQFGRSKRPGTTRHWQPSWPARAGSGRRQAPVIGSTIS